MTRHRFRVQADAYGVHLEVAVEHSDTATRQELERALTIAAQQALAAHAQEEGRC